MLLGAVWLAAVEGLLMLMGTAAALLPQGAEWLAAVAVRLLMLMGWGSGSMMMVLLKALSISA